MWIKEFDWLRGNNKLDPNLKKSIVSTYGAMRGVPCFLHSKWVKLNHKRRKFKVILTVAENANNKEWGEIDQIICNNGCKLEGKYENLNFCTASLNIDAIKELIGRRQVIKICEDREVSALLDVATPTVSADLLWEGGVTGKGVRAAVIDTGVYPHPDLIEPKNRLVDWVDLVNGRKDPYDDNGHGTHVAGCLAGNGKLSGGRYKGPAPKANIIGIKALNKRGSGSLSVVIKAIDWCLNKKHKINIICLSLGSQAYLSAEDDPVCLAVKRAWEMGIIVCAAAGNEGPGSRSISSPGIQPDIITVGATDDKNTAEREDDTIAPFSSRGPTVDGLIKPDLVAPGTGIISLHSPKAFVGKKIMAESRVGEWYIEMSGTSMATPIVAGLAAQILEVNPTYTPNQVKQLLLKAAEDIGLNQNTQGKGYVDFQKIIVELMNDTNRKAT